MWTKGHTFPVYISPFFQFDIHLLHNWSPLLTTTLISFHPYQGLASEWALLRRHESEDIFGVQLCGKDPVLMAKCAEVLGKETDVDFIDLNCGCPIDLVFNQGCGSALMGRRKRLGEIVQGAPRRGQKFASFPDNPTPTCFSFLPRYFPDRNEAGEWAADNGQAPHRRL